MRIDWKNALHNTYCAFIIGASNSILTTNDKLPFISYFFYLTFSHFTDHAIVEGPPGLEASVEILAVDQNAGHINIISSGFEVMPQEHENSQLFVSLVQGVYEGQVATKMSQQLKDPIISNIIFL